jgi:hypothetical protein
MIKIEDCFAYTNKSGIVQQFEKEAVQAYIKKLKAHLSDIQFQEGQSVTFQVQKHSELLPIAVLRDCPESLLEVLTEKGFQILKP